MAHKIDQNKVERIETPYGNGYAYGGRIYSDKQWKAILDFNAGGSIVPGGYSDKTGTYDGFSNKMIAGPEGEIQTENQYRNAINYGDAWNSDKPWGTKTPEQAQYFKDMNASATKNKVIDSNGNIINPKGFKRGGRALAAQEEAAWNKEMGIDDASVRADEAAINASKDALEQSYSDKNDAAEDDRIDRYSSASDIYNNRESSMNTAYDTAEANYAEREANPLPIRARPTVAKGAFDETGDAENAPVSLINNQTTYKKPVKKEKEEEKQKEEEITKLWDRKDEDLPLHYQGWSPASRIMGSPEYGDNPSKLGYEEYLDGLLPERLNEERRTTKLNEKSRELDKLWKDYTKSHPGITSRQWYNSSVGGTADLKSGEYVQDPIVLERNKKYQKDHPEEYKSYTWNPQFRKGESVLGSSSFSKPFTGPK